MRMVKRLALLVFGLLGSVAVIATVSSCTPAPAPEPAPSVAVQDSASADAERAEEDATSPVRTSPAPAKSVPTNSAPTSSGPDVASHTIAPEGATATCKDSTFTAPATVPDLLAELVVPFYPCVQEMVAMLGSDPLFVGEYDTNQAMIIVEMKIKDQFDASDWDVTERTVEGDNSITMAQKPGYTLVVVIAPSRTVGTDSSIHYTLREQ